MANKLTFQNAQTQIDDWIKQFGYFDAQSQFIQLSEESGELSKELMKSLISTDNRAELEGEIFDVLFTLSCFANGLKKVISGTITFKDGKRENNYTEIEKRNFFLHDALNKYLNKINNNGNVILSDTTINEAQNIVLDYINKNGGLYSEAEIITKLYTSTGELGRIVNREYGEQSKKKSDENLDIEERVGNVLFILLAISAKVKANIEEIFPIKLDKKMNRDTKRHEDNKV